jgi:hypothetical protein
MVPPSPNELKRKYRNPHVYARLRDLWHQAILCMTHPPERDAYRLMAKHRQMQVQVTIHNAREYDPDNLVGCQKPLLDALVMMKLIHDDSRQWLKLEPVRYKYCPRAAKKTEITITLVPVPKPEPDEIP